MLAFVELLSRDFGVGFGALYIRLEEVSLTIDDGYKRVIEDFGGSLWNYKHLAGGKS